MADYRKIFFKNPYKPSFWLILGLIVKGAQFLAVILNHPYRDIPGIWGATQADDSSYLVPIDNLLHHGTYFPDFRMPGYGVPYFFFRLIFSQAGACNALIVLQIILASASVYYLALMALNVFKNNSIFYITFYLFLFCSFSNFFDAYIASESLCTSSLIFSVYFFTQYFSKPKKKYLFYSGLLGTWAMFIRPVFGGVIIVCCILIFIQGTTDIRIKLKSVFFFLIPFLICEGYWVSRNFQIHKKLILFTTSGSFYPNEANSYLQPLFEFIQSWAGVSSFTNKPSDLDWFQYHYPGLKPITHFDSLPNNIYTSAFNKDTLLHLKRMILALQNPLIDTTTASMYQNELRLKFNQYRISEEKEKPLTYFVVAPIKMMGVMLYNYVTGQYLKRGQSVPLVGKLLVVFNYLLYFIILLPGLAGCMMLLPLGIKQSSFLLVIPLIPIYTILIHPFIFRFFDNRFLMPAFPFLIISASYFIHKIYAHYSTEPKKVE